MLDDYRQVLCYLGVDKKVRLQYFDIDGEGNIVKKEAKYTLDNVSSSLYEYYLLHVIKKDYVSAMSLFVEAPYLYFEDIYQLGLKIGKDNIDGSKLYVYPIVGGE